MRPLHAGLIALWLAACGPAAGSAAPTLLPPPSFANPNLLPGLLRGSGGHLLITAPPAGEQPAITAEQATTIAAADAAHFIGFGHPSQAVLVEMTRTDASGALESPPRTPNAPSTLTPYPWANPCLCWIVDMTSGATSLDPVHARFPVTFAAYVIDGRTGAVLDRVIG